MNYVSTERYWFWSCYYVRFPGSWQDGEYCNLPVKYDRPIFTDSYYLWKVGSCGTRVEGDPAYFCVKSNCYNSYEQVDQTVLMVSNHIFKWWETVWDSVHFHYVIASCIQWRSGICFDSTATEISYWYIDNWWVLHTIRSRNLNLCDTCSGSTRNGQVWFSCDFLIEWNCWEAPAWSRLFFKDCSTACLCYCNCYSYYVRNFWSGDNGGYNYYSSPNEWTRATPFLISIEE